MSMIGNGDSSCQTVSPKALLACGILMAIVVGGYWSVSGDSAETKELLRAEAAEDRCVMGILGDAELKQATEIVAGSEMQGAVLRSRLCSLAIEKIGDQGPYRDFIMASLVAMQVRKQELQTSW